MAKKKAVPLFEDDVPPPPIEKPKGKLRKFISTALLRTLETYAQLVAKPIATDDEATCIEQALLWSTERQKVNNAELDGVCKSTHGAWQEALDLRRKANAPFLFIETRCREMLKTYRTAKERAKRDEEARLSALQAPAVDESVSAFFDQDFIDDDIPAFIPVQTPAPVVSVTRTETTIPMKEVWTAKVINPKDIIDAMAKGLIPLDIVTFDEVRLNQYADQFKVLMRTWPGLEVDFEMVPIAREKGA